MRLRRTLRGYLGAVCAVAWSPDGKTLAGCCEDHVLRLWDAATGQPRFAPLALPDGQGVAVSPDGHYRGTPQAERLLRYVVQTDAGQETLTPEECAAKYGWKNDPEKVRAADK